MKLREYRKLWGTKEARKRWEKLVLKQAYETMTRENPLSITGATVASATPGITFTSLRTTRVGLPLRWDQ